MSIQQRGEKSMLELTSEEHAKPTMLDLWQQHSDLLMYTPIIAQLDPIVVACMFIGAPVTLQEATIILSAVNLFAKTQYALEDIANIVIKAESKTNSSPP